MAFRTVTIGSGTTLEVVRSSAALAPVEGGYLARTSLAVLASPPVHDLPLEQITTDFRRALVRRDAERTLGDDLDALRPDLIVLDALEERFGLLVLPEDRLVTATPELAETGLALDDVPRVAVGSDEHLRLWSAGWAAFLALCDERGWRDRLRVHEVYIGVPEGQQDGSAARFNAFAARLYEAMRADLAPEQVVGVPAPEGREHGGNPLALGEEDRAAVVARLEATLAAAGAPVPAHAVRKVGEGRGDVVSVVAAPAGDESVTAEAHGVHVTGAPARIERLEPARYRVHVPLGPSVGQHNGAGLRLRVSGWDDLGIVWLGDVVGGKVRGIKFRHLRQDVWLDEAYGFEDPLYLISNRWPTDEPRPLTELCLEIEGRPGEKGAAVEVEWAVAFREESRTTLPVSWADRGWLGDADARTRLVDILAAYLRRANPHALVQARAYLASGDFPVFQSDGVLPWPTHAGSAAGTAQLGTYRYLHHSLALPAALLLLHREEGNAAAAVAARELTTQWMDAHFYRHSDDPIYAWYDHGSPMRLMTMLLIWQEFCADGQDARFRARLEECLEAHGVLLASDAFYAHYQPLRYQNHAWFQDVGLMALGTFCAGSETGQDWLAVATSRLDDQFHHLVVDEGDVAVWSENSVGYHFGLISLIRFTRTVAEAAGHDRWPDLTVRMQAWSNRITYPDGRYPAVGDTLPALRPGGRPPVIEGRQAGVDVWPAAGYAQARGLHGERPWRLFVAGSCVNLVHKHADNLSFSLWQDGIEWLVDPGLVSYDTTSLPATYARGPWAHNAVALPGVDYSVAPGTCTVRGHEDGEGFVLGGSHTCYDGAVVHRDLSGSLDSLVVHGADWVDRTDGATGPAYSVFHAAAGVDVAATPDGAVLRHPGSAVELHLSTPGTVRVVTGLGDTEAETSLVSRGLERWEPSTSVLVEHPGSGQLTWTLEPREPAEAEPVEPTDAEPARVELTERAGTGPLEPAATAPVESDYSALGLPVHTWPGVPAAVAEDLAEGVHRIGLVDGNHLDLVLRGDPRSVPQGHSLVVFLSGAISQRNGSAPPFFAGRKMSNDLGVPWIALSDPTLQLDPEILLSWYTGAPGSGVQDTVVRLLTALAERYDRDLLLVGGSGGGFASLWYAARLGGRASVFAWNPQTEVLDYEPNTVVKYLATIFPGQGLDHRTDRAAAVAALDGAGLGHTVDDVTSAARILVIQNAGDHHVLGHFAPLLRRADVPARGVGRFGTDDQHLMVLESWGDGHAVLPADVTRAGIEAMMRGATAEEVADLVRERTEDERVLTPEQFPRDLREEAEDLANALVVEAERVDGETVRLTWCLAGRPAGYGGTFAAAYVLVDAGLGRRLGAFDADGSQEVEVGGDGGAFRVYVRDGLGHELARREVAFEAARA